MRLQPVHDNTTAYERRRLLLRNGLGECHDDGGNYYQVILAMIQACIMCKTRSKPKCPNLPVVGKQHGLPPNPCPTK